MMRQIQHRTRCRRETGSAYIVTLLALVVLTIVGLSLSLISQTERELGVNEINTQRIFYAANSGLGSSTARALGLNNYNQLTYISEPVKIPGAVGKTMQAADRVEVSCFHEISDSPANATELDVPLRNVHYVLTSTAERAFWSTTETLPDEDAETRSAQTVGEMITVQPWETSVSGCFDGTVDIRF